MQGRMCSEPGWARLDDVIRYSLPNAPDLDSLPSYNQRLTRNETSRIRSDLREVLAGNLRDKIATQVSQQRYDDE